VPHTIMAFVRQQLMKLLCIDIILCSMFSDNKRDYDSYTGRDAGQPITAFILCTANGCQSTACAHSKYHFMAEKLPCLHTVNITIVSFLHDIDACLCISAFMQQIYLFCVMPKKL